MKKINCLLLATVCMLGSTTLFAQKETEQNKDKNEIQEIIIKKKGDKDATLSLSFKNGDVIVNGKPLVEFNNGDEITINKRKVTIGQNLGNLEMMLNGLRFDLDNGQLFKNPGTNGGPLLGVVTETNENGAFIKEVSKNSAAEKAGLKKDDIITMLDKTKITDPQSLAKAVKSQKVDDKVKITYLRDGKSRTTDAKLGVSSMAITRGFSIPKGENGSRNFVFPDTRSYKQPLQWDNEAFEFPRPQKLGIRIQDTPGENGVTIISVQDDSPAAKAGIEKNDVLMKLDGKSIKNIDDARMQLKESESKRTYSVVVERNGKEKTVNIEIPKKLKSTNL